MGFFRIPLFRQMDKSSILSLMLEDSSYRLLEPPVYIHFISSSMGSSCEVHGITLSCDVLVDLLRSCLHVIVVQLHPVCLSGGGVISCNTRGKEVFSCPCGSMHIVQGLLHGNFLPLGGDHPAVSCATSSPCHSCTCTAVVVLVSCAKVARASC